MTDSLYPPTLPVYWQRLVLEGEADSYRTAHLFPRDYYTALCGFNAEESAGGILFARIPAAASDKRCGTCRQVAESTRFQVVDETAD